MSKHCPKCHQSFSDSFEECAYCGSELHDGEYVVYYDNIDLKTDSKKSIYLKVVYYDLENVPQSIELLCSNCKKIFEIDEKINELFDEITPEHLTIKSEKCVKCPCGNTHPLDKITFQNIAQKVSSQPIRITPVTVSSEQINVPKCPTCQSTNIKKISGLSKAGSVAMWGIFSRKVHKQWHCNNCGSEW